MPYNTCICILRSVNMQVLERKRGEGETEKGGGDERERIMREENKNGRTNNYNALVIYLYYMYT